MIEKFNFYDIYGYFLPGLALLGVFWLPFGLVRHAWSAGDWTSAIVGAALAYLLGHLLQIVATRTVPSRTAKDSAGKARYASDTIFDPDSELASGAKLKIAALVKEQFGLDLHADQRGDSEVDKQRNSGFLLARQVLIQGKAVSYAEQFQGMYALMRGLMVALVVAAAYWSGWAASVVGTQWFIGGAVAIVTVATLLLVNIGLYCLGQNVPLRLERTCAWFFLTAFFALGSIASLSYGTPTSYDALLLLFAAWALLMASRTYDAYRFFAGRFASTVWRDFLAYNVKTPDPASAAKP
ncbi:MAG: hypothetical protein WA517_20435 [Candidatus Acidiferrum sp.]